MTTTVVGVDIGSAGVRAAELAVGRRAVTLKRYASVPLPAGAVRAGIVAEPAALTEALRTAWSQGRFRSKTAVLGIANDSVLVRQMDLEWMPPAEFRKALRYMVADSLPVSVDEANLDYYLLDEPEIVDPESGTPRKVARVMLVAAARDMVDGFVNAARDAGIRPVRADLLPFALVRAAADVRRSGPPATADDGAPLEAIVDVGADKVVVVVHQGGRPRSVRTIPGLGGESITKALQERYRWTWEDAERTKIVVGLTEDHPARADIAAQVDVLADELRTTLDFFLGSTEETPSLSRVQTAGNASRLAGLTDLLAERLAVPVEPLAAHDRLRTPRRLALDEEQLTSLAVPAGLCLGVSA
jgi:type IV pilus assembly protein PilM